MNNLKIIAFYVTKLKAADHLKIYLSDQMLYGYKNIISHLCDVVFLKDYYTYDNLMEASKLDQDEKRLLLDIIHILTEKKIDILNYKFEIYDEDNERMVGVNAERVFRSYLNKEFFHPITGKILSLNEFNDELIPFFSTTDSFKLKVKQDRNVEL